MHRTRELLLGISVLPPSANAGTLPEFITNCWTSFEQLPHALEIFSMESRLSITAHYETALPFPPSPPLPLFKSILMSSDAIKKLNRYALRHNDFQIFWNNNRTSFFRSSFFIIERRLFVQWERFLILIIYSSKIYTDCLQDDQIYICNIFQ